MTSLGRTLRALPTFLRIGFAGAVAYRSEFFIWVLTTNMPLVMLALWSAVARDAPVGQFTQKGFVAYFLATLIVRMLTGAWVVWELNMEIRQGSLSMKLLRPVHPLVGYATDNLAALPLRLMLALPLATGALLWVGRSRITSHAIQWVATPFAIAGAWAMNFCILALIGTLGMFFESSLAVADLWLATYFVFSGYIMPLALLPHGLYAVVRWLPFRFVLSFPVENMLGLVTPRQSMVALAVQWGYAAFFLFATLRLWKLGLKRYAAYGG